MTEGVMAAKKKRTRRQQKAVMRKLRKRGKDGRFK